MKAWGVLILAGVALWGCGVGVDDADGQQAAGAVASVQQAMVVGSPEWLQARATPPNLGAVPSTNLPFDPVPVVTTKPLVPGASERPIQRP